MQFPLRVINYREDDVQAVLRRFDIICPDRTDCGDCYHQRLGEWFEYWRDHREAALRAVALEKEMNATFRTPGRDAWPSSLSDLFAEFARGKIPTRSLERMQRERMKAGTCRVCSL